MTGPDDLEQWDDDPLVRALRAPGTPAELSTQEQFLAAYRAHRPGVSLGRFAGRFGLGAGTVVATIALSGGMAAAAYTKTLPDPVQRFAHEVLGPVGVPPAPAKPPVAAVPSVSPVTSEPAADPVAPSPSASEAEPGAQAVPDPAAAPAPVATAQPGVSSPTAVPTPTPSGSASPATRPTAAASVSTTPLTEEPPVPPRRAPAALSIAASEASVAAGWVVTISGVLTDADGLPLRNRAVRMSVRTPKQPPTRLTAARTDKDGRVALQSRPLVRNTIFRLRASQQVRSSAVRVVVVPVLKARATNGEEGTTIAIATSGGRVGESVVISRRDGDTLIEVGRVTLGEDGTGSIVVPTPKRVTRLVLHLPASREHGRSRTSIRIGPQGRVDPTAPEQSAAPGPSPSGLPE